MTSSMGNLAGSHRNVSPPCKRQNPNPEAWDRQGSVGAHAQATLPRIDNIRTYLDMQGYKFGEILGEGSYSKVRSCSRYSTVDGKYMYKLACKIIDKCRASNDFVTKFLPRELKIVRVLNHPNIVRVWDVVHLRDNVYIFMDFCHGGDLLEFVKCKGLISENRSRHYFRQIVSAVRYLHSLDIAHRDLKCENVLMTGNDNIKLSDFGFARYCHNEQGKRILSNTYCGSAAYAAPEILQGTGYNPKLYDCWSIGCVLFIMVTGHMPFDESDIPKMLKCQMERKLMFPTHSEGKLSISAKLLIRRLLEPDVTRRGNIEIAANHEWTKFQPNRSVGPGDDGSISGSSSPRSVTASGESTETSSSPFESPGTSRPVTNTPTFEETVSSSFSRRVQPFHPMRGVGRTFYNNNRRRHVGTRGSERTAPSEDIGHSVTPRSGTAKPSHMFDRFNGTENSSNRPMPPRRR